MKITKKPIRKSPDDCGCGKSLKPNDLKKKKIIRRIIKRK